MTPIESILFKSQQLGYKLQNHATEFDPSNAIVDPNLGLYAKIRKMNELADHHLASVKNLTTASSLQQISMLGKYTRDQDITLLMDQIRTPKQLSYFLERILNDVREFNGHLDQIVENKDALTHYLQQPYSNDSLKIKHTNQLDFYNLIHAISKDIAASPDHFNVLKWMAELNLQSENIPLESNLELVTTLLAKYQRFHESLNRIQKITEELYDRKMAKKDGEK